MTTSEQDGQQKLTRKQLREIRLTGSTPVITEAEATAASQPATVLPRAAEPVEIAPVHDAEAKESGAPLTRRQMRALEHAHAADDHVEVDESESEAQEPQAQEPEAAVVEESVVEDRVAEEPVVEDRVAEAVSAEAPVVAAPATSTEDQHVSDGLVSGVPPFDRTTESATAGVPRFGSDLESPSDAAAEAGSSDRDQVAAIFDAPTEDDSQLVDASETGSAESDQADELEVITAERPVVGAAFGLGVKPEKPAGALFDDLLDGRSSSGSHHSASTALIFTPSVGAGSLSGPIASTGELLITGTYALPDGIGSQGHAHGTTDGRDADAVLLDGELAPASSPTPIAASSAISTSKSAGEVIRPPTPDKGNKLMLTLAIVAGGLALALAATLIIASTTGVFG
jgi:hypothetical protein